MPTTPREALEKGRAYVARNDPGRRVLGLREDGLDYLLDLEPLPGVQLGGPAYFITKFDGVVRQEPAILKMAKILEMTPVSLP